MERAALERDVIYSNLSPHAVLVQSKAQSTAADPVGFAQPAAVVGYLELGDLQITSKSCQKVIKKWSKWSPRGGPGPVLEARSPRWTPGGQKDRFWWPKVYPKGAKMGHKWV